MSLTPAADTYIVRLISPCYEEISVEFRVYKKVTTVYDLMVYASENKIINLRPDEMKFLHMNKVLEPKKLLSSYPVTCLGDTITVIKMMMLGTLLDKSAFSTEYSEFLRSSFPEQTSVDVPVDSEIILTFGPCPQRGIRVYTPALIDKNNLQSSYAGDMVHNLGSMKEAKKRGFTAWTEETFSQRVYLLQLPSNQNGFAFTDYFQLERIRYSSSGVLNMGYDEGDHHSWQRYTTQRPLFTSIREIDEDDLETGDIINILKIKCVGNLEYDTYYAILLSNNVPTVPDAGCDGDFTCYLSSPTSEDHLIAFKTMSEKRERELMPRRAH